MIKQGGMKYNLPVKNMISLTKLANIWHGEKMSDYDNDDTKGEGCGGTGWIVKRWKGTTYASNSFKELPATHEERGLTDLIGQNLKNSGPNTTWR